MSLKGIDAEIVDGLDVRNRDRLAAVNGRVEVPALVVDELVIVGSADILAFLDRRHPNRPMYPSAAGPFAQVRAWERCADTYVDAIITPVSIWSWAERDDTMPAGLIEAARRDLALVYERLNDCLARSGGFLVGDQISAAECAMFPHLTGVTSLGLGFDAERHGHLARWVAMLRNHPAFAADIARATSFLRRTIRERAAHVERHKIFWRGDRLEWLLARGFHDWLDVEIRSERVIWPGSEIPR